MARRCSPPRGAWRPTARHRACRVSAASPTGGSCAGSSASSRAMAVRNSPAIPPSIAPQLPADGYAHMTSEQTNANGLSITYEDKGPRDAPVILLVMGLGGQLTLWPDEFVDALNVHGFRTIRYDNRDVGLSTRFEAAGVPNLKWMFVKAALGLPVRPAYTLADMAADAVALLD